MSYIISLNAFFDCLTEKKHQLPLRISTSFFLKMHQFMNGENPFQFYQKVINSSEFDMHDIICTLEIIHTSGKEAYFTEDYSKMLVEHAKSAFHIEYKNLLKKTDGEHRHIMQMHYSLLFQSSFTKEYQSPHITFLFEYCYNLVKHLFGNKINTTQLYLFGNISNKFSQKKYAEIIDCITILEFLNEFKRNPDSGILKKKHTLLLEDINFIRSFKYYTVSMKKFFLKNFNSTQEFINLLISTSSVPYDSYQVSKLLTACTETITLQNLIGNSCFKDEDPSSITMQIIKGLVNKYIDRGGNLMDKKTYNIPASFIVKRLRELDLDEHGEIDISTIITIFSHRSAELSVRDIFEFLHLLPQKELSLLNLEKVFYSKLITALE